MKSIVLGGGCFWCIEAVFQRVKGVEKVVSGYAGGGSNFKPSYWDLHSGKHGHAEVVEVTYNPETITLEELLDIFFNVHDPTTLRQPGTGDDGQEYRSIISCAKYELSIAENAKNEAQKLWNNPIITEIKELDAFYPAEENHQNYYNNNQSAGYCQVIINPKLAKYEEKYSEYIK